jgi:hypothetical protein
MKSRTYTFVAIIVGILVFGIWRLNKRFSEPPNHPSLPATTNSVAKAANGAFFTIPSPTNSALTNFASPGLIVSTNLAAAYQAYKEGKISKGALITAGLLAQNNNPQEFYGKVIDQYDQPVAGVNVTGYLRFLQGIDADEKVEAHKTQTDTEGLFQFTGLHGAELGVKVAKEGYQMGQGHGFYKAPNSEDKTRPTERAVFKMWKLKGPEPMIHDEKFYGINPDGRIFTIDLVNKKKIEGVYSSGDLLVQIQRPSQIQLRNRFDWSFIMTAIDGGVIRITENGYLNEAPEAGYQPKYEINMFSSDPQWQEQIEGKFYLKSRGGQVYGHFHVTIIPNYNDTSVFKIDSYINPVGSRNLEFDPLKQIR